ncbi:hypothetical protein CC1G_10803 [Coprinopsis cinerea okayama7|uniref:Integral membrane protein n=1 Tax=Coprinopsis cinerea (strain Okayama-7 / 130 / ATCC MYA-4618 / FGSC 9003) TaxID=240176 RepID=A8NMJ4_COPC7|nr:hypothetical protein CC1G_10803 [Coprinopsis cinerea okayama7\|eukprot:XP_001834929.1 hypothetical protein CC1G_10803 [Coprinopsis cinerea okayama7\
MTASATLAFTGFIPVPTVLDSDQEYNPFPHVVAPYVGAVFMETFLYGICCVLFSICAYVLIRRQKALHWVLLVFAIAMFALATADMTYTFYIFFSKILSGGLTFNTLYPKYVMFVTNTVLADTLLLYRCYVVWGSRKRIIAGPAVLLVAATVCGYLFEGASIHLFKHAWVYLALTFSLNVILTGLTAGRIWYISRRAKGIVGDGLLKRYNASIAILIESGMIYSVYMTLDLAFHNNASASAILDAGLIQVVGIVPTLIIVQVGLGRAVHEIEEEAQSRMESSKAHNSRSFSFDGAARTQRSSLNSSHGIRSHRGSNATLSPELAEHRRSFRSTRSARSYASGNRRTGAGVYDLTNLSPTQDSYTLPSSPRSLPPSPVVLTKPELSRSVDGKIYQAFVEPISLVNSRDSSRTLDDDRLPPV